MFKKKAKDTNKTNSEVEAETKVEDQVSKDSKAIKKPRKHQVLLTKEAAKKKRTRRITGIVTLVCSLAVAAFMIIAFVGYIPGSFTINLKQTGVRLALDTNTNFENPTTYLKLPDMPQFDTYTADMVDGIGHNLIDTEQSNHENDPKFGIQTYKKPDGTEFEKTNFFKFTFFVRNMGTKYANFSISLNIIENNRPKNVSYGYDSILRVRLYDNDAEDLAAHEYTNYARRAEYKNTEDIPLGEDGKPDMREDVALNYGEKAEVFETSTTVCSKTVSMFGYNQTKRYTFVAWLEGSDVQCIGEPPEGGSLKLGVSINGVSVEEDK